MKNRTHNGIAAQTCVFMMLIGVVCLTANCPADTFKKKSDGQTCHGYATLNTTDGKTAIMTTESGKMDVFLSDYDITPDAQGRNKIVSVIAIDDQIFSDFLTEAFEKAIVEESNKGPLFIVIEIDSPGGRRDLAMRLCSSITKTNNCQTAAYIKNGKFGGVRSVATFVALACNKVYISNGTSMGGNTSPLPNKWDLTPDTPFYYSSPIPFESQVSNWKDYIVGLAEKNHRPLLFLKAMEGGNITILKIQRENNKILYINANDKANKDQVLSTISTDFSTPLTLLASQTVEYGVADKVVSEFQEILTLHNATDAKIERSEEIPKAAEEIDKIFKKFKEMYSDVKTKFGVARSGYYPSSTESNALAAKMRTLKDLSQDCKTLIRLTEKYPDFSSKKQELTSLQTEIDATYEVAKSQQLKELKRQQQNNVPNNMAPRQYRNQQRQPRQYP